MFHSYDDLKAHRKEIHGKSFLQACFCYISFFKTLYLVCQTNFFFSESSWKDIFDSEEEDEAKSFYEQLLLECKAAIIRWFCSLF